MIFCGEVADRLVVNCTRRCECAQKDVVRNKKNAVFERFLQRNQYEKHNFAQAMTAYELYMKGNEYRRAGNFQAAMNCFLEAENLDPEGPAKVAREMLEEILNFYCKDIYNP